MEVFVLILELFGGLIAFFGIFILIGKLLKINDFYKRKK